MTSLALSTQSAPDRFSGERLLNYFARPWPDGAVGAIHHVQASGLSRFSVEGLPGPVRAIYEKEGTIYAIGGSGFYEVTETTVEKLADVIDDPVTTMAEDGLSLLFLSGGVCQGYNFRTGVVSQVNIANLDELNTLTWLRQHFIVDGAGLNGRKDTMAASDVLNGYSWPGFATAEEDPDEIRRVLAVGRNLWILGSRTFEVYYGTGTGSFPFAQQPGATGDIGVKNAMCAASYDDEILWVGNDDRVYRSGGGYTANLVSSPAARKAISGMTAPVAFVYLDRDGLFFAVRDQSGPAWVMNMATGLWSERNSGPLGTEPWLATCAAYGDGAQYVGGSTGYIYRLDETVNRDDNLVLRREIISKPISDQGRAIKVSSLGIEGESGVGGDPQAVGVLEASQDGMTWRHDRRRSLGALGDYKRRIEWKGLGRHEPRTQFRFWVTDDVRFDVYGANIVLR